MKTEKTRKYLLSKSKYEVIDTDVELGADDFEDLVKFFRCIKNIRDKKGIK